MGYVHDTEQLPITPLKCGPDYVHVPVCYNISPIGPLGSNNNKQLAFCMAGHSAAIRKVSS